MAQKKGRKWYNGIHMEPNYGNKYDLKKVFIDAFSKTGLINYACYVAGISVSTFYRWLKDDSDFNAEYLQAGSRAVKLNTEKLRTVPVHKRCLAIQVSFDMGDDLLEESFV